MHTYVRTCQRRNGLDHIQTQRAVAHRVDGFTSELFLPRLQHGVVELGEFLRFRVWTVCEHSSISVTSALYSVLCAAIPVSVTELGETPMDQC